MAAKLTLFGADWCGDTQRARMHLEDLGVPYRYRNIDQDEDAEERVITWNHGKRKIPVICLATGDQQLVLTNPEQSELDQALSQAKVFQ